MFGIKVEADLDGHMLYIVNEDAPGFTGRIGTALGEAGLNIGTFPLGRRGAGGEAVLLLSLASPMHEPLVWQLCQLPGLRPVSGQNGTGSGRESGGEGVSTLGRGGGYK